MVKINKKGKVFSIQKMKQLKTELKLRGFSKTTIKAYVYLNSRFLKFTKKPVDQINETDIKEYIGYLMADKKMAPSSVGLIRSALKFYFDDVLHKNIVNLKAPKNKKKLPTVLTKSEIKSLLKAAKTEKSQLLIKLLYSSGLRLSEALNLKVEHLELDSNMGWVRSGKGGKDRMFILSERLSSELRRYVLRHKMSEYIFVGKNGAPMGARNAQKIVKRASKLAKINKKVSPHTLRHSFATHLLEAGVGIRQIQELLGHANLQTTQIYTKVSTKELLKIKNPLDQL